VTRSVRRSTQGECHKKHVTSRRFTHGTVVQSSLVNTLPITKKNKYTVVTEAHKECTYAAYAPANLLQKANSGSNWRLSSERVGGTECSFVCHVQRIADSARD